MTLVTAKFLRAVLPTLLFLSPAQRNYGAQEAQSRVICYLTDGSKLVGAPAFTSIPIRNELATLEMPLARLTSVEFADGQGVLFLRNGDRLPGIVGLKTINLQTVLGHVSIPLEMVRRIDVIPDLAFRESLVLRFPFEEVEAGKVIDTSGHGNNGTLVGRVGRGAGKSGGALVFDGTTAAVRVPASASLNVGTGPGLTLEAWIRPDDVSLERPIFEWNAGAGPVAWSAYGLHFWISQPDINGPGSLYVNLVDSEHVAHNFGSPRGIVTSQEFQHVALTYDKASGIAKIFRNGVVVAKQNVGTFTPRTDTPLYLGWRPIGPAMATRWLGRIDEPAVYNRALTEVEIQEIFSTPRASNP